MTAAGGNAGPTWLAKGACARCGRPVARRAQGPGTVEATCNVCRALTRLPAKRVGAPPGEAAKARSRLRAQWIYPLLFAVTVLLVGGLLVARHVEEPPPEPPAARPGDQVEWVRLNQTLLPLFHEDLVTFRVLVEAYDANGSLIPPERVARPGEWLFGRAPALVPHPDDVTTWTTCLATRCAYQVPPGEFVYFDSAGLGGVGTAAFDTDDKELFVYEPSGWRRVEDWETYFNGFDKVRASPADPA